MGKVSRACAVSELSYTFFEPFSGCYCEQSGGVSRVETQSGCNQIKQALQNLLKMAELTSPKDDEEQQILKSTPRLTGTSVIPLNVT